MRAFATDRFGPISGLTLRELPSPVPGARELLVRVRAAAVNPADLKVLAHRDGGAFLHAGKFPLVLGYDFSGVVEALGAGVSGRAVGDEVFGFLPYARNNRQGSYAEQLTVAADAVGKKPRSITHEEAAAAATSTMTALQALRGKGRLQAGQSVLINGASGGVGSYAVQLAKSLGARVVATASAGKLDYVKGLGADQVYDYKATPLRQLAQGGGKFEMVFDVASTSSFGTCAPLLTPSGAFVALLPSPALFLGMGRALFSSKRCGFVITRSVAADLEQVSAWFDEGKLKPVLERAYRLEELPLALERQRAGDIRGKLAITVSDR